MFRLLLILGIVFSNFVISFAPAFAACDPQSAGSAAGFLTDCASESPHAVNPANFSSGKEGTKALVIKIAERVMQFGALFAVGAIVFSGLRYIASAGDDEKLKSAKNTAIYAIIGLVLLLIAFPLVDVIVSFFYSLGQ